MSQDPGAKPDVGDRSPPADHLDLVRQALQNLTYGQIVITVHDGSISQVERTEKLRPPPRR
jgi:hypothetical protein